MAHIINHGFIKLTGANNGQPLYAKAKHIVGIGNHQQTGSWIWTINDTFWVEETVEQITELLEAVHPDFL